MLSYIEIILNIAIIINTADIIHRNNLKHSYHNQNTDVIIYNHAQTRLCMLTTN